MTTATGTDTGRHLRSATFTEAHRGFKAGRTFTFRPGVNLIVGDQGTGKSTLLAALAFHLTERSSRLDGNRILTVDINPGAGDVRIFNLDFEKSNPRTVPGFNSPNIDPMFVVQSRFVSHGESSLSLINSVATDGESKKLVLWDEPDTALSPRSAHHLAQVLDNIAATGHAQLIVAVHNPIVIASQRDVYSLDHKRWVRSSTFLNSHEPQPAPTESVTA